jgi:bifunctional non-homologous end joining protein LigD
VFDLLWLDGTSLHGERYEQRRGRLEALALTGAAHWQTGPVLFGDGGPLVDLTRSRGFEGVVAKRVDSLYYPGIRSREWVKAKNKLRQELVVGGWIGGEGGRLGRIGALLLGHYADDGLHYAGRVGSGFTSAELDRLAHLLAPQARADSPFVDRRAEPGAHWVEPVLVAEVEYTEWTNAGTLRHPVYKGLRDDKDAADVHRE